VATGRDEQSDAWIAAQAAAILAADDDLARLFLSPSDDSGTTGPRRRPRRHRPSPGRRGRVPALLAAIVLAVAVGGGARELGLLEPDPRPDDPTAYAFLRTHERTGAPVVWDPCLPIQLVVNDREAPPGAEGLLPEAVERVSAASGLRLEVTGTTLEPPDPERTDRELRSGRPGSGRAPVLVAWTNPSVVPRLEGSVTGIGGPVTRFGNASDTTRYIGGSVYLDAPQISRTLREDNGHAVARSIVMHELGHLLGLDHVDDTRQVMAPKVNRAVTEFAAGDLAGLRRLGSGGCPYSTGG
jgi:hypothetical protein